MVLSRKWLTEFVDLPLSEVGDREFDEAMTVSGSKVETTEDLSQSMKNVKVGRILSIERHPNSDHMLVLQLDVGEAESVQICTGAWNVHVGDLVPAALHNARLPGGVTITKGKLRGVVSNGMLCSLKELNMTEHDFPYGVIEAAAILGDYKAIDPEKPSIRADIHLSSLSGYSGCEIDFSVLDAAGNKVVDRPGILVHGDRVTVSADIENPHLWNGRQDPYLYKTVTVLKRDGKEIDRVEENIGLRYFSVDPDKGFFLNGKHMKLHGVCRHQDWADIAVALKEENHLADFDFFDEMGVDALRLAHYPQAKRMFQEADRRGYVVWEEIPFVGGYVNDEGFHENLRQQLREMIIQNYNHPSICFWGIFNEIHGSFDAIVDELNAIAHEIDPFRLTVSATDQEGSYNLITDGIGWNKYYGWYTDSVADFGPFMDDWHARHPQTLLAISEYGGGASVQHHVAKYDHDEKAAGFADPFHPEERQVWIHRNDWKAIAERDYVWGSFVWNMFDFASSIRREGDTRGQNDKGLVTRDRKERKDAFYFYKANWNKAVNTVHLCSKRYVEREGPLTDVIVFTTAPSAKLYVNGKLVGLQKTDAYSTVIWKDVALADGANEVVVKTAHGDDSAVWTVSR